MQDYLYFYLAYLFLYYKSYIVTQTARVIFGRPAGLVVSAACTIRMELIYALLDLFRAYTVNTVLADTDVDEFAAVLNRFGVNIVSFAFQMMYLNISPYDWYHIINTVKTYLRRGESRPSVDPVQLRYTLELIHNYEDASARVFRIGNNTNNVDMLESVTPNISNQNIPQHSDTENINGFLSLIGRRWFREHRD